MRFAARPGRFSRLAVLGVLALLLWAGCEPSEHQGAGNIPHRPRSQASSRSPSLLFLEGRSLFRLDVASGRTTKLEAFPAPDVRVSPGSGWIAYVVPGRRPAESHPDFLPDPQLRFLDGDSGETMSVGRGFSPLWNPSGSKVAYLRSSNARSCDGETCSGEVSVRLTRPASGKVETILKGGSYGLLGWAGNRLVVADGSDTSHVLSVAPSGHRLSLPLAPSQFWGASPDGRWIVRVGADQTAFVRLRAGRLTSETKPITLRNRLLAAGTWAADSSGIAAVALHRRAEPAITILSPEDPELRTLPHSSGAGGAPLWSSDGRSLVFPRDSAVRARALDAIWCPNVTRPETPPGKCRSLLTWRGGVVLLRME